VPDLQLGSDAAADAAAILDALRGGRVFSSIDALADRPSFEFVATSGRFRAVSGEVLPLDGPLRIDVAAQAPPGARILLLRDGAKVLDAPAPSARFDANPPIAAAYRAEVVLPTAPGTPPVSWIVSNPIYVGRHFVPVSAPAAAPAAAVERAAVYTDGPAQGWTVEHSAESRAALDVAGSTGGTQLLFRYAIAGPAASHPFAALVVPAGSIAGYQRVSFAARSDRPMRLSVQVRGENGTPDGERWHRSVFVDTTLREVSVRFDDMRPRGATQTPRPRLEAVRSLLFVVDTVNTASGSAGQVSIDEVRYER
jgi:hypothetical protein